MSASHVQPERIGQIAILVQDLPRAVAFYRDVLGLRHLFDAGQMAFFDCGGVRLMLTTADAGAPACGTSLLYYEVDDLDAAQAALAAREIAFLAPPHCVARLSDHELWMAFLRDSEENLLALTCQKELAAKEPAAKDAAAHELAAAEQSEASVS